MGKGEAIQEAEEAQKAGGGLEVAVAEGRAAREATVVLAEQLVLGVGLSAAKVAAGMVAGLEAAMAVEATVAAEMVATEMAGSGEEERVEAGWVVARAVVMAGTVMEVERAAAARVLGRWGRWG